MVANGPPVHVVPARAGVSRRRAHRRGGPSGAHAGGSPAASGPAATGEGGSRSRGGELADVVKRVGARAIARLHGRRWKDCCEWSTGTLAYPLCSTKCRIRSGKPARTTGSASRVGSLVMSRWRPRASRSPRHCSEATSAVLTCADASMRHQTAPNRMRFSHPVHGTVDQVGDGMSALLAQPQPPPAR